MNPKVNARSHHVDLMSLPAGYLDPTVIKILIQIGFFSSFPLPQTIPQSGIHQAFSHLLSVIVHVHCYILCQFRNVIIVD